MRLGGMMQERAFDEIVFIDETTFHLWQKVSKCWLRPGMKLSMLKNRGPSITVIGAISQERGLVHLDVFEENNNAKLFQHFLIGLREKCKGMKVAVVQDNLRIHHAKLLEGTYNDEFQKLPLPTYSSALNPIESLWSLAKRRWSQNLFHFTEELA